MATEHLKCSWSELRYVINVKYTLDLRIWCEKKNTKCFKKLYVDYMLVIIFWIQWVKIKYIIKISSFVPLCFLKMWLLEMFKLNVWFSLYFQWTVLNLCKKLSLLHTIRSRQPLITESSVPSFLFTFSPFSLD